MIRIAVDGRVIQDRYHGIGRYTLELIRAMARQERADLIVLYGHEPGERLSVSELAGEKGVRLFEFDTRVASFREQLGWRAILEQVSADALLVPYHLATPWFSATPSVAILHDCIFESDTRFAPTRRIRLFYRLATRLALGRAAGIVTVSEATRASLHLSYGVSIDAKSVVHHGVNTRFSKRCSPAALAHARAELGLPPRYVLHVGVRRPHKNQLTLVRAFTTVAALDPPVDLVLVGEPDERFSDPVPTLIDHLGLAGRVHLLPSVSERLLPAVYQSASAFAFPSLVEGFGLPILEAMAAGVPVVASDTPAVVEAAGGAALVVPAHDVPGWSAALVEVLTKADLARDLRRRGAAVAKRSTWDLTGRRMLELIESTAATAREARTSRAEILRRRLVGRAELARAARDRLTPVLRKARPAQHLKGTANGRPLASSAAIVPALGAASAMSPRERTVRSSLLLLGLLAILAAFLARVALGSESEERVPTGLNAAWVVPGTLMRGGQPRDIDFVNMRDVFGITGVVNFREANRIERHVARGFRLDHLWLRVAPEGVPTNAQLRRLVRFLKAQKAKGGAVFIHDHGGLEEAPAVAVMLDMLHGKPTLEAVHDAREATPADGPLFSAAQVGAINALADELGLEPYRPPNYTPGQTRHRYPRAAELRW